MKHRFGMETSHWNFPLVITFWIRSSESWLSCKFSGTLAPPVSKARHDSLSTLPRDEHKTKRCYIWRHSLDSETKMQASNTQSAASTDLRSEFTSKPLHIAYPMDWRSVSDEEATVPDYSEKMQKTKKPRQKYTWQWIPFEDPMSKTEAMARFDSRRACIEDAAKQIPENEGYLEISFPRRLWRHGVNSRRIHAEGRATVGC